MGSNRQRYLRLGASVILGVVVLFAAPCEALCIYTGKHFTKSKSPDFDGRLYATTTLSDEFTDAALVVRGTLLSMRDVNEDKSDPDGLTGTVYQVRIDKIFKGKAPTQIGIYTERDSGGFYLEGTKHWLLFLNPATAMEKKSAREARGRYTVNYNCGQSRPWAKVSAQDVKYLSGALAERLVH